MSYEYYLPINDEESVLLIDSRTNQAALDAHHASSLMRQITELREQYRLHMQVERYESDENGIPETDRAFIKT